MELLDSILTVAVYAVGIALVVLAMAAAAYLIRCTYRTVRWWVVLLHRRAWQRRKDRRGT